MTTCSLEKYSISKHVSCFLNRILSFFQELTSLFGTEWAIENLIPPILEIREHKSYLRRLTALKACAMMATAMDPDSARMDVLPVILDMATDVVS
jgi:hypothetical protein